MTHSLEEQTKRYRYHTQPNEDLHLSQKKATLPDDKNTPPLGR